LKVKYLKEAQKQ